jgi:CHAD domain-containing protein
MDKTSAKAVVGEEPPDVLKHLADSLKTGWKRYCKRLRRCQKSFSQDAVHDSRVQTRRLLSTVELLVAFISEKDIQKVRRALKDHLDTFDDLRDTQVQLDYMERLKTPADAVKTFRAWLQERERGFTKKTRKAIKHIKTRRIGRCVAEFQSELRKTRKKTSRVDAFERINLAMNLSFDRVAQLCRNIEPEDTETIHRTRVAFKRFRYMVEALSPLLPIISEQHCHAMRGYQSMMGDIQDVEVLLATFDKFVRKEKADSKSVKALRAELVRRRKSLIRVYLNAADKLSQFWPPPGLAPVPKSATVVPVES